MQKELIQNNLSQTKLNFRRTGGIGLVKTAFIEEDFLHKLKLLEEQSESRFSKVAPEIQVRQPLSPLEKIEIEKIIIFLHKVKQEFPDNLNDLESLSFSEKLLKIEVILRNISNLAKEFHNVEKYERNLAAEIERTKISSLLKRIYESPQVREYEMNERKEKIFVYPITPAQLRKLEKEADKINACKDPSYEVKWTRWWRERQRPETDVTTGFLEPHINVTIKLGGKKKDIHLLVA